MLGAAIKMVALGKLIHVLYLTFYYMSLIEFAMMTTIYTVCFFFTNVFYALVPLPVVALNKM